jgi:hypothetical protein
MRYIELAWRYQPKDFFLMFWDLCHAFTHHSMSLALQSSVSVAHTVQQPKAFLSFFDVPESWLGHPCKALILCDNWNSEPTEDIHSESEHDSEQGLHLFSVHALQYDDFQVWVAVWVTHFHHHCRSCTMSICRLNSRLVDQNCESLLGQVFSVPYYTNGWMAIGHCTLDREIILSQQRTAKHELQNHHISYIVYFEVWNIGIASHCVPGTYYGSLQSWNCT